MENNNEWSYNLFIGFVQMLDFWLNVAQISNDQLFQELQHQDKILNEQNEKYLKKILENQNEILELLKGKK